MGKAKTSSAGPTMADVEDRMEQLGVDGCSSKGTPSPETQMRCLDEIASTRRGVVSTTLDLDAAAIEAREGACNPDNPIPPDMTNDLGVHRRRLDARLERRPEE